ncbi:MAG: hypothetical protein A3K19_17020 [Lentisphaerae bacterium RIFOXYB12_FULL_65_16]|nr:MAG: hypothetical protein A3K18_17980 [Lentisphaerae bacterium RIFOXYA12_64_32]OGV88949.1 MAG: hypothetical protein A3K19_17020 [Lentisphaerae bacterium RIFOXYB12_FULL_65_16]
MQAAEHGVMRQLSVHVGPSRACQQAASQKPLPHRRDSAGCPLRRVSRRVGTYTFGSAVVRSLKRRCSFRLKGGTQTESPE